MADFGDILSAWEKAQSAESKKSARSQKPNKKANASFMDQADEVVETRTEADARETMTAWLNLHGVVDKDRIVHQTEVEAKLNDREYLRTMRPEAVIDLHGLTRDEAWSRLDSFVGTCRRRGLRKILVIHGKGNHSHGSDPVLGPMVRTFIEQDSRLGASGHPDRNNGGSGATWVLIK